MPPQIIKPPPGCFFNEEDHTYWHGMVKMFGISEILRGASLVDEMGFNEEARQRGSDVHLASTWLEDGEVDWENLEAVGIAGYMHSYERFLKRHYLEIIFREQPVYNVDANVAGTPDRAAYYEIRNGFRVPLILDIKSGSHRDEHELQVAGYDFILPASVLPVPRRLGCLYLDKDGDEAQFICFRDYTIKNTFRAAVSVVQWKAAHGRI